MVRGIHILAWVWLGVAATGRGGEPGTELRTAVEVRRLQPKEAEQGYRVCLRGVLTYIDKRLSTKVFRFIDDGTAGIYFFLDESIQSPPLATGQLVQLEGRTGKGAFAPVVYASRIEVLGKGTFPAAKPVSFEQLISGQEDSQFVELRGLVRSVRRDEDSSFISIDVATGGGRLMLLAGELPLDQGEDLVDRFVAVRGVCMTQFNSRRQLFDIRLLVPRREDLVVEGGARGDAFSMPSVPIESLLQFAPEGAFGRRVKVEGTVTCRPNDDALYVQDGSEGLYVETKQRGRLEPGDRVEILGFPAHGEYTPMLQDGVFRKVGTCSPPKPDSVSVDEALKGTHDCRLVRVVATVLDRARRTHEEFVVLQVGDFIFHACLEGLSPASDLAQLQSGSEVAVTGVCLIEKGGDWFAGDTWRAKSFRVQLRSVGDIELLKRPPWWTLRRLLWMVGLLGAGVLVALTWVAVLRRRVRRQTGIISQKLQAEAAMKERYQELVENANDMVFTHDLTGVITSINQAGERLLRLDRDRIQGRNLADLVAEEQRIEAQEWIEQVVSGVDSPATEWDFVTACGQRLKLEISTRMVRQGSNRVEVEGIARDITERKRLEKEILEVSNREQRRIGHDLHDGVCQQLAAIAYLTDILADRLRQQDESASAEAERIGRLLGESITQARGVARGLFPVRLEENGLISALEELAANTSGLFKVNCRFSGPATAPVMENGAALHLYYIVQEAVLNAAKHGKAAHITISLAPAADRFTLTVQDDGAGFPVSGAQGTGMGIRIMRYRARVVGAILEMKSQPGCGTQVACTFYPAAHEGSKMDPT